MKKVLLIKTLLLVLLITCSWIYSPLIVLADSIPTKVDTRRYSYPVLVPDFDNVTWSNLFVETSGSYQFPEELIDDLGYDPSATWRAGDRAADVLELGNIASSFGLEQLSIDEIVKTVVTKYGFDRLARETGIDFRELNLADLNPEELLKLERVGRFLGLENLSVDRILKVAVEDYGIQELYKLTGIDFRHLTLNDFKTISWQTVPDLLEGIPYLKNLPIRESIALYDFFTGLAKESEEIDLIKAGIGNFSASKLIGLNPSWGKVPMGELLDLQNYDLSSSIPGLVSSSIFKFDRWGKTLISQIPGLNVLPFSFFPLPFVGTGQHALVAGFYRNKTELCDPKLDASWYISGSTIDGFTTVKKCDPGSFIGYVELTDAPGAASSSFHGKRYISGKDQKVPGGKGVLKAVGGGVEPTGRSAYFGSKLQVVEIDETSGRFKTALGIPFCHKTLIKDFGCTPHIFWLSWLAYSEGMLLPVGGQKALPIQIPRELPEAITDKIEQNPEESQPENTDCNGSTGKFIHPAPGATVTSHFGNRRNPFTGQQQFHNGTDFGTPVGYSIKASDGGTVAFIFNKCQDWGNTKTKLQCNGRAGNWIVINHGNGYQTRYLHLQLGSLLAEPGDSVCQGQVIGKSGNSGGSTGPHLHFEILKKGIRVNAVNFFKAQNYEPIFASSLKIFRFCFVRFSFNFSS